LGHTEPKISELAEVLAAGFDPSKVLNLLELKLFKILVLEDKIYSREQLSSKAWSFKQR
jgi:hypothetical protein